MLLRAMRQRADLVLVERGFFESRAKARAAIEAGLVIVNGLALRKPADGIAPEATIEASAPHPYVSRGGLKLAAALEAFGFDAREKIALDLGASTGGFTDVLLRAGAAKVYAIDVGHDQLHKSLRENPRIVSMEGVDARQLKAEMFDAPPQLVVCDVSFISLKLVLPHALALASATASLATLIKPQFEAGRARVKKGVVRDVAIHEEICADIRAFVTALGWRVQDIIASPIEGGDGNREFLLGATRQGTP